MESHKSTEVPVVDIEGYTVGSKSLDRYEPSNDTEAQNLMMFFDKNTKVEFSNTYMGRSGNETKNLIMTTHDEGRVYRARYYIDPYIKDGYQVIRSDHNHPGGGSEPSGKYGDMGFKASILEHSPNAIFRILAKGVYYPY